MQSLTGRNLFPLQLVKGLLCRLVEHQLVTMFFKERFAVPGLAVRFVALSGLGVIIDVRLQCSNLNHPFLSRLNGIGKFREAGGQRICEGNQIIITVHAFFFQKAYCPGSFFAVVFLCPLLIANRFSFRHLRLNINEKVELLLFRCLPETTLRLVQAFPGDNGMDFFLTIPFAQRTQADKSLLLLSPKRRLISILKLEPQVGKNLNKIFKTLRLLFEYRVDSFAKFVTLSSLFRENRSFLTLPVGLRCDDRKPMLRTHTITQLLNRQTGKEEVVELPGAVNGCRIINDVIVYMGLVDMGCNNESMVALRPAHCRFVAHLICFFRGYFSGLEGLAYLIGDDVILLLSAGDMLILPFGKKKFFISSLGIAFIGADKLAVIGFCSILRVVGAVSQTLSDCFTFVYMERNQSCCCLFSSHPFQKKSTVGDFP